jgi:Domain of unknown function (DUF4276)
MTRIYLEGGGSSRELHSRCREAFQKLLEGMGFQGRMPRLVACGGRGNAFDDFRTAFDNGGHDYVALLVDSEEPIADIEAPWTHLAARDGWQRPSGANDDHALLMVTSMDTWIVSDRTAIQERFGSCVKLSALPPMEGIEARSRQSVLAALKTATANCTQPYAKGAVSFELVATLSPEALERLPSFARVERILYDRL